MRIKELDELRAYHMNSENQIKLSSQKASEFENRLNFIITENQRLNQAISLKDDELNQIKYKFSSYEINIKQSQTLEADNKRLSELVYARSQELEQFKVQFNNMSSKYNEYQSLINQNENKLALVTQDNERKFQMLRQRDEEILALKQKYSQYEI